MTPDPGADRTDELREILERCEWFRGVLQHVATMDPPEWWVNAGVIRDIVWDTVYGDGFKPEKVRDVDVGFFDTQDLTRDCDAAVERALRAENAAIPWDAKNQAAVHLWYPARFGVDVPPFASAPDSIATFPEYAVCVGARLERGALRIEAPYGLTDLLDGIWRRNPARVGTAFFLQRLASKQPWMRWPSVRIVADEPRA